MPTQELEGRVAKLEGISEQISQRLNHLETIVESMRKDLNSKMDSLRTELLARIDTNFKWILGIMIPMWVTIILAVIFK
ncbi:MAG: hypothetical protein ACE5K3_03445 [bacterium]